MKSRAEAEINNQMLLSGELFFYFEDYKMRKDYWPPVRTNSDVRYAYLYNTEKDMLFSDLFDKRQSPP
jgi:hypothetical protein